MAHRIPVDGSKYSVEFLLIGIAFFFHVKTVLEKLFNGVFFDFPLTISPIGLAGIIGFDELSGLLTPEWLSIPLSPSYFFLSWDTYHFSQRQRNPLPLSKNFLQQLLPPLLSLFLFFPLRVFNRPAGKSWSSMQIVKIRLERY